MKLIINLPDDEVVDVGDLMYAVKHGTPLPEHHGRLIDADAFKNEHPLSFVRDVIENAPTIIKADKGETE